MNKRFMIAMLIGLVLAFGIIVAGCNDKNNSGDDGTIYSKLYVTVSDNGGSSFYALPNNTNVNYGPNTDSNSYAILSGTTLSSGSFTKTQAFNAIKSYYPGYPTTESGNSITISGFPNTLYRVRYTLQN